MKTLMVYNELHQLNIDMKICLLNSVRAPPVQLTSSSSSSSSSSSCLKQEMRPEHLRTVSSRAQD
jgi:hypothetical protein